MPWQYYMEPPCCSHNFPCPRPCGSVAVAKRGCGTSCTVLPGQKDTAAQPAAIAWESQPSSAPDVYITLAARCNSDLSVCLL